MNSHCFKLHRSYSISFKLANVRFFLRGSGGRGGGGNRKRPQLSLEKENDNFCVEFNYSIKRACEIRKFHVAVVQRRRRNVQNSVMHVQSCCFVNKNLLLFCRSPCRRRRCWFCCHPEIVLPR